MAATRGGIVTKNLTPVELSLLQFTALGYTGNSRKTFDYIKTTNYIDFARTILPGRAL